MHRERTVDREPSPEQRREETAPPPVQPSPDREVVKQPPVVIPVKTDMERKIEIFNFASRTRMLLVRLLALVRWASSASKVCKVYLLTFSSFHYFCVSSS